MMLLRPPVVPCAIVRITLGGSNGALNVLMRRVRRPSRVGPLVTRKHLTTHGISTARTALYKKRPP